MSNKENENENGNEILEEILQTFFCVFWLLFICIWFCYFITVCVYRFSEFFFLRIRSILFLIPKFWINRLKCTVNKNNFQYFEWYDWFEEWNGTHAKEIYNSWYKSFFLKLCITKMPKTDIFRRLKCSWEFFIFLMVTKFLTFKTTNQMFKIYFSTVLFGIHLKRYSK